MTTLEEDIKKAKEIITGSRQNFRKFNTNTFIYKFTNESIDRYQKYLFNRDKILSVTASGDQILNSILFGSKEIDSFDISRFPKYYFELKKAAILSFSRDEFLDFFVGEHFALSNGFISHKRTIESKKIKEYYSAFNQKMKDNDKYFWDEIFRTFDINQVFKSPLFNPDDLYFQHLNPYLYDGYYESLQKVITDVEVHHYVGNIKELSQILNTKYDFVHLSNIINYTDLKEYREILNHLSLSENGIALSYIPFLEKYVTNFFYQEEYQFDILNQSINEAVMIYQKKK